MKPIGYSTMRELAALSVLALAALGSPAVSDTVYLANGNKSEDVVARQDAGSVRIRLSHGEIVLPARLVERIERSPSVWRSFDERAAALEGAKASEWLELARWAETSGYETGARRALLRAAELDPGLAGLAGRMSDRGYRFDAQAGRWLAEDDYMRDRGYRRWGERWLPAEEHAARLRQRDEAERARREEARQERLTRAIEALVVARSSRPAEAEPERPPPATRGPVVAVYPGIFPFAGQRSAAVAGTIDAEVYAELARRQPGSLMPLPQRRGF